MTGYKFIFIFLAVVLSGCSTVKNSVKEAHNEFRREVDGFRSEWARVILKKEVTEGDLK